MGNKIINLTRTELPYLSKNSKEYINAVRNMPEMVLKKLSRNGDKSILHVSMNTCVASKISKDGINTVYTDALACCNSVGIIAKTKDGKPLTILSHYMPNIVDTQVEAISKELAAYSTYIDKNYQPKLFFNIRGNTLSGKLEVSPNSIIEKVKNLLKNFFNKDADSTITPYPIKNRPAFFSTANIFQFDPENLSKLKITNVGEVENFVNL